MAAKEKTTGFLGEFKTFIARGNVLDMAVGVIVGGAFNKIVNSLVADVIMPLVGVAMGGVDVTEMKYVLNEAVLDAEGAIVKAENALMYGNFLQTVIDFFIIALTVFVALRVFTSLQRKRKDEEAK